MSGTTPTPDEVKQSIVPKSDQLNADDLTAGPITVTIAKVKKGSREQPIIVEIEGHRPYKPCKTMLRILVAQFTPEPKGWIGQRMTLYRDPDVLFHGVRVGGIRISHLSGLVEPKTFVVTHGRGKRAEVTVHPIDLPSDDDLAYIEETKQDIAKARTAEELKAIGFILKEKSTLIQDAVRATYAQRKQEIQ